MILTRKQRIAVQLLGPPGLGFSLFYGFLSIQARWVGLGDGHYPSWDSRVFTAVGIGLLVAYIVAGVPSLFYMLILEWCFARGLNPGSWQAVGLSSFLGLMSGCAIIAAVSGFHGDSAAIIMGAGTGLAVGLLLGLFIKTTADRTGTDVQFHE